MGSSARNQGVCKTFSSGNRKLNKKERLINLCKITCPVKCICQGYRKWQHLTELQPDVIGTQSDFKSSESEFRMSCVYNFCL